jgi:hypothetical protein
MDATKPYECMRFGTLGGKVEFFKGRKSVICGVLAAPGAPDTLPKGGGLRPPSFGRVSRAPGAAQTPKRTYFRSLFKKLNHSIATQSAAT